MVSWQLVPDARSALDIRELPIDESREVIAILLRLCNAAQTHTKCRVTVEVHKDQEFDHEVCRSARCA
jgi:hypothetical protein